MRRRYPKRNELFYYELPVAGGIPLFSERWYFDKLSSALKWCCERRGLRIFEYVILPDRICMIVNAQWGSLPETIQTFCHFTSKAVMQKLREGRRDLKKSWIIPVLDEANASGSADLSIWEKELPVRSLLSQQQVDEEALRLKESPVKAGFVKKQEHYLHSSACPVNPLEGWQVAVTDRGI